MTPHTRKVRPMCDYVITRKTPDNGIIRVTNTYCTRSPQFWVQSLLSSHNSLTCAHHLARTVRSIEAEARKYDLLIVDNTTDPDPRYIKLDAKGNPAPRTTRDASNYARVTVKPYTPRDRKAHN